MKKYLSKSFYQISNWILLLLAGWLFISPWVFAASTTNAWNSNFLIVGMAIGSLALAAMLRLAQWKDWVNFILGAWLFISPLFLGTIKFVSWNAFITGILIAAVAVWGILAARRSGLEAHRA